MVEVEGRQCEPLGSRASGHILNITGYIEDYVHSGRRARADCVYPIFAPVGSMPELVSEIGGPVNAHASPNGPTAAELIATGATRISYGASLHIRLMDTFRELLAQLAAVELIDS